MTDASGDRNAVGAELRDLRSALWSLIEERGLGAAHVDGLEELAGRLKAIAGPALSDREFRPAFLRCGSILIETAELFGHSDVARGVTDAGASVFEQIETASKSRRRTGISAVLREEIRFAVNFAYNAVHRKGDPENALTIIDRCVQILDRDLVTNETPCFATRGHARFHRALVERQVGRDDKATADLQRALEFFAAKATNERISGGTEPRPYPRWLVQRAVDVLTEMGFAAYSHGSLSRALEYACSAELVHVNAGTDTAADVISSAYVTLLRSAVQRSMMGRSDPSKLRVILEHLKNVEGAYTRFGHRRGQMRARYEQAQTYLYLADRGAARQTFESVRELAESDPDQRWICHVDSQLSKIATSLDEAIAQTSRALEHAERFHLRSSQIDALLARAEALLKFGSDPARARADIRHVLEFEAIKKGAAPRILARCLLLMATSHLRDGDSAEANVPLREARNLLETVEHAGLRDFLRRVEAEREALETEHDFRIRRADAHKYREHQRRLQRWLLAEAQKAHSSDRDVATALGISRMTLYKWRDAVKAPEPLGRRKKRQND